MPEQRHFTTRRGFVAALGFGAVSVYGAWAVYGAAPLPFGGSAPAPTPAGHGGHGSGALTPDAFRAAHEAFVSRFRQPDGSVAPGLMPPDPHAGHHGAGHAGHGDAAMAPADPHAGHDAHAGHGGAAAETEVYLLARRWGYDPEVLRLRVGVPYRFRMLSDDIPHGASILMGGGSRIIRLRPDVVTEQLLTFTAPGEYLVYCTVYCGAGHDAMSGRIIVA